MEEMIKNSTADGRKPYAAPQITCELELETRAGSPLGAPEWDELLESEQ